MSSILVFGTVRRVAKGLRAARHLTWVRPLSSVTSQVGLLIFQSRISFLATRKLQFKYIGKNFDFFFLFQIGKLEKNAEI